ncbi:hypothetical protein TNCV_414011 [Trichonephila clavipes]|nr:hypothetical protein TNCV_414011 [Trichonephila clavipes]
MNSFQPFTDRKMCETLDLKAKFGPLPGTTALPRTPHRGLNQIITAPVVGSFSVWNICQALDLQTTYDTQFIRTNVFRKLRKPIPVVQSTAMFERCGCLEQGVALHSSVNSYYSPTFGEDFFQVAPKWCQCAFFKVAFWQKGKKHGVLSEGAGMENIKILRSPNLTTKEAQKQGVGYIRIQPIRKEQHAYILFEKKAFLRSSSKNSPVPIST